MIVYGHPDYPQAIQAMRDWINARLLREVSKDATFIGRTVGGQLVAVCAFAGYTRDDVELSLAAEPGSGSIELIAAIFGYVFDQLGCARATAKVREDNAKSLHLIKRLGFRYEGRQRQASEGKDLLMYGLLKDDYGKFTRSAEAGRPQHDHSGAGTGQPHRTDNAVRQPDV